MTTPKPSKETTPITMPSAELVQQERTSTKSIDDFFGAEGIFARLFSRTLKQMLEAEMTQHLGYEKYEAKGRNSRNSRNGKTERLSLPALERQPARCHVIETENLNR